MFGLSAGREEKLGVALCCVVESGMDTEVVYGNLGTVHGCMLW